MEKSTLIKNIEDIRESRVITYITSDRQGPVGARIAMDIIPVMSKQLRKIGKTKNIDLFFLVLGRYNGSLEDSFNDQRVL